MSTNTEFTWYWYIRNKGRRKYLGLVNRAGDDPSGAYTIEIYYYEVPDEVTADDDTIPIPQQYEMGIIKGVAADLMAQEKDYDKVLRREFQIKYNETVDNAIHQQIEESQQPMVQKPLDFRDDD